MRIALHDHTAHPFTFSLSVELARLGHEVGHFYYPNEGGPKASFAEAANHPTLTVFPIDIAGEYTKGNLLRRRAMDVRYGKAVRDSLIAYNPDVVICGNAPIEVQGYVQDAARKIKAGTLYWVQDLHGIAIKRIMTRRFGPLGVLIGAYYTAKEASCIRNSDMSAVISEAFTPALRQLGVPAANIEVQSNWPALDQIAPKPKVNEWTKANNIADKFVFLYSGTLALKHNPDLLWSLAEAFRDDDQVVVMVCAAGVSVDALAERQKETPLPGLRLLPLQPIEEFEKVLGGADVAIALLESDAGEFSVPSKILSYLCAARPVLISAPLENQASEMVRQAKAGVGVAPSDEEGFVRFARQLRADGAGLKTMGRNGRAFAEKTFDLGIIARRFEGFLEKIARK